MFLPCITSMLTKLLPILCVLLVICENASDLVQDFIAMVLDNIFAAENYIMPVNNSKLYNWKGPIYDYGYFDFIVVGAGSAGSILANRLSEISNWKVLLLEAGGPLTDFTDIPGMHHYLLSSDMNWGYNSTPQKQACLGMKNRQCIAPRGKVIGGSSTVNARMYVRGNKKDFDNWVDMGNPGWSYDEILPYFIKSESNDLDDGESDYHGQHGELFVSYTPGTVFRQIFLDACGATGHKILDYNGRNQIGANKIQFNIRGNKSENAGKAFINVVSNRTNLIVTHSAFVTKLLIDNFTRKVYGVRFVKNGKRFIARIEKEVILSAGAFNTPQILMLSGIGPRKHLTNLGIKTINNLPVGQNMQDHSMFIGLVYKTNITLYNDSTIDLLKQYLQGKGPYMTPFNMESTSFINLANDTSKIPEIQIITMVPTGWRVAFNLNEKLVESYNANYNPNSDIVFLVVLLHPKSRGTVTLKSKSPLNFLNIDYNYFSDTKDEDIETVYQGILRAVEIAESAPFRAVNATIAPVLDGCREFEKFSKDYWYCAIRHLSTTIYHPVGTTRMGNCRTYSVVDNNLVVHNMRGLRVVDAGVMPEITSGNINAPTYMIAEKISDVIKSTYEKFRVKMVFRK